MLLSFQVSVPDLVRQMQFLTFEQAGTNTGVQLITIAFQQLAAGVAALTSCIWSMVARSRRSTRPSWTP